eukprot:TRINITY_DN5811_c0_g2_i1.p1 TRINITY_DN5811_c0_g2~~TRINITY_DN5811_c0_g2_i1.p1  ORF type:complete len:316 (+),score=53.84 TRINITY_DN5811_c0_g2_i1:161-1108(+)
MSHLGSVIIGRDAMKIIFQFVVRRMIAPKSKKPRATLYTLWKKLSVVCKDWNQLAWEVLDVSINKNYPIRLASRYGSVESIKKLLTKPECDPSHDNNCAIREACTKGHHQVLRILLADPRIDPSKWVNMKICEEDAAKGGYLEIIKVLDSDPRIKVNYWFALLEAIRSLHYDIVEYLLPKCEAAVGNTSLLRIFSGYAQKLPKEGALKMAKMISEEKKVMQNTQLAYALDKMDPEVIEIFLNSKEIHWDSCFQEMLSDSPAVVVRCLASCKPFLEELEKRREEFVSEWPNVEEESRDVFLTFPLVQQILQEKKLI